VEEEHLEELELLVEPVVVVGEEVEELQGLKE